MTPPAGRYLRSGKVRDLYAIDEARLLLVASGPALGVRRGHADPDPDKGRVLTGLTRFWFNLSRDVVANHLLDTNPEGVPPGVVPDDVAADLRGRMLLCRRATVLPIEVVIRGYLSGSGWKDYRADGAICGVALPPDSARATACRSRS